MRKAIVTGIESFGQYMTNPTKWLALSADGKEVAGYKITSLVFPCTVVFSSEERENPGQVIVSKAKEIGADVILSFGMTSMVKGFRLEKSGSNWSYSEKYLSSNENNKVLDSNRPEKEKMEIDMDPFDKEKMKSLFKEAGLLFDSEIYDDPGYYSCNAMKYQTLLEMKRSKLQIPYLFVHTACTKEAIELIPDFDRKSKVIIKKEDTLKALEIVLNSLKL